LRLACCRRRRRGGGARRRRCRNRRRDGGAGGGGGRVRRGERRRSVLRLGAVRDGGRGGGGVLAGPGAAGSLRRGLWWLFAVAVGVHLRVDVMDGLVEWGTVLSLAGPGGLRFVAGQTGGHVLDRPVELLLADTHLLQTMPLVHVHAVWVFHWFGFAQAI